MQSPFDVLSDMMVRKLFGLPCHASGYATTIYDLYHAGFHLLLRYPKGEDRYWLRSSSVG
jgi:hypothetical protein